jgi:hypothetical protein
VADNVNTDGGGTAQKAVSPEEHANLQKALTEERTARQALAAQIAKAESDKAAAEEAAKEAKAKEKGQYGPLYEAAKVELDTVSKKLADYEAREVERRKVAKADADAIVQGWAEADRALMPTGLDEEAQLAFARRLDARFKSIPVSVGARSHGGSTADPEPPPECVAQALRLGKDPKEHFQIWKQTTAGKKWANPPKP